MRDVMGATLHGGGTTMIVDPLALEVMVKDMTGERDTSFSFWRMYAVTESSVPVTLATTNQNTISSHVTSLVVFGFYLAGVMVQGIETLMIVMVVVIGEGNMSGRRRTGTGTVFRDGLILVNQCQFVPQIIPQGTACSFEKYISSHGKNSKSHEYTGCV